MILSCIDFHISFSHTKIEEIKSTKVMRAKEKEKIIQKKRVGNTYDMKLCIHRDDRFFPLICFGMAIECLSDIGQGIGFAFTDVIPENVGPFQQEHRTGEETPTTNQIGDNRPLIAVH